jgi:hypothetical protein
MSAGQAAQIRGAAAVFRELYDDGYIDWNVEGAPGLDGLSKQINDMVSTYEGCRKAPA